jgi:hypothetical protein
MGKKKKNDPDIVDNDGQAEVTLNDFVIPSKILAFSRQFEPMDHWTEDCEVFNDARLREYFKAIVCPLGDPLSLYLQELDYKGFHMQHDESGEPVIYCRAI